MSNLIITSASVVNILAKQATNLFAHSAARARGGVVCALVCSMLIAQNGAAQDISINSDLKDSELSLSLSTTVSLNETLGGSVTIGQFGLYNTTNIVQSGSGTNTIEVTQQGNNNQADITQLGIDNQVTLLQEGENNLFSIVQNGDGNIANVNQLGEQTFNVIQIGDEMVVNVTQYRQ